MRRILFVVLAGCGSSAPPATTTPPSNQATEPPRLQIEDEQLAGGTKANDDPQLARQQVIEQARAAGILGDPSGSASGGSAMPPPTGHLDKAMIRTAVHTQLDQIRYCYEKVLLAKPALHGTTRVEFTVDPNGTVVTATASGLDPEVDDCVAAVIKAIKFPATGAGVTAVSYPFVFHPADSP